MNRIIKIIFCFFIEISVVLGVKFIYDYNRREYLINNINVNINVDDNKEYMVTETIDISFKHAKHGIVRTIGSNFNNGYYNVYDVSVDGAPFETEKKNNKLLIKIGDKYKEIFGDKEYVIKYTIKNFESLNGENNIFDFDILGNEWNTDILKFSAQIVYPEEFFIDDMEVNYNLFGGSKSFICDHKQSSSLKVSNKNNTAFITSDKKIPAYRGIKTYIKFNKNVFNISAIPDEKDELYFNNENNIKKFNIKEYFLDRIKHLKRTSAVAAFLIIFFTIILLENLVKCIFGRNIDTCDTRPGFGESPNASRGSEGSGTGGGSSW